MPPAQCPHFDRCFLFRARRRAAEADVVVVNHHLLAADLSVRRAQDNWEDAAVLPPYKRLVLDEGHHLEEVAASHLGVQVTSRMVRRLLSRFERNNRGLAPTLLHDLAGRTDQPSRESAELLRERLFPALGRRPTRQRRDARPPATSGSPRRPRVSFAWATTSRWMRSGTRAWRSSSTRRSRRSGRCVRWWRWSPTGWPRPTIRSAEAGRSVSCGALRRMDAISDGLNRTLRPAPGGPSTVRWMERSARSQNVQLSAVPLDLAPLLRELLFDRLDTVVLTSATLAASGDFDFLESRLGLGGESSPVTERQIFPSPFDYPSQCLFGVPTDLPEPREDEVGHGAAVVQIVCDLAFASDGGMFVLFTSHASLRRAAAELRMALGTRWPPLVQGEAPRDVLLRRFREAENAILLGTDSFWEGVDLPGRALRALVINKVPFKVPTEPLTAARLERLAEEGQDGFVHYLLPHAALKLKQGFGRLIRSRKDLGVMVLVDSRAVTKRYGPMLLGGLPRAERVVGTWSQVRTKCEDFFAFRPHLAPCPPAPPSAVRRAAWDPSVTARLSSKTMTRGPSGSRRPNPCFSLSTAWQQWTKPSCASCAAPR